MTPSNTGTTPTTQETTQDNLEANSMTETNGNGQVAQKLLDLAELTGDMELKREFEIPVNTIEGEQIVTAKFTSWDDNPDGINGLIVGEPSEWAQPVSSYYDVTAALGAVSNLGRHQLVDPEGLVLYKPYEVYAKAYKGDGFGWVSMTYAGEVDVPAFGPRLTGKDPESFSSAWGELVKKSGVKEIGFVAVSTPQGGTAGKHYRKIGDWKRAQNAYANCQTVMQIFNEGGIHVYLGDKLSVYAEYFLRLWNLREVNPEAAAKIAKQSYKLRITKNNMRVASQKEYGKLARAEEAGSPVAPITVVKGVTLVEGQSYSITNYFGVGLSTITFSLNDKNTQAILRANVERIEAGKRHLVEVGF